MRSVHYGLLWQRFREEYPKFEEHAPLASAIEKFGEPDQTPEFRIEMTNAPTVPRVWFLNNEGTQLIQIQQDRFTHNWRERGRHDEYPRYESIREKFRAELGLLESFIAEESLGQLQICQCEVTYVNHIYSTGKSHIHQNVNDICTLINYEYSDDFLDAPENLQLSIRYVIPNKSEEPIGRLHISIDPQYLRKDLEPLLSMTLTARGVPRSENLDGCMEFLDIGREWIVRGFTSITTRQMHKIWERIDGS